MKLEDLEQGNKYKFTLSDDTQEGKFVNLTKDTLFIKLESGYNIGIHKDKVKKIELIEKRKTIKEKKMDVKPNTKLPKILILHTGGTIASKVDYSTGAVIAKFTPEELVELFPELTKIANIESKIISNMMSDDMNFSHYNIIGEEIQKAIKKDKDLKGIILTQGTDTLHYTSAALSFMLENLPIPVVIVGSQRSSDRPSSDAATNILNATYFISEAQKNNFHKVVVCMHNKTDDPTCQIILGVAARKNHSSRRDAFQSVNKPIVAKVNFENKEIKFTDKKQGKTEEGQTGEELKLKKFDDKVKIGLVKSRPGFQTDELKFYKDYSGLILEGTGLGHFPINKFDEYTNQDEETFKVLKQLASKMPVAMTVQTINGRVNMNVYTPGRKLQEIGVLGHNLDMHPETAYIKLAWLVSNYKIEEVKELYGKNLRGEISDRSQINTFP